MAQVIKKMYGEVILVSDLAKPAYVVPPQLQRQVVVVENFLEDEQIDKIEFILDERFRERAIQELIDRGEGVDPATAITERDLAGFVRVDLQTFTDEDERTPTYLSTLMKSPLYRQDAVERIIDTEFKEFV